MKRLLLLTAILMITLGAKGSVLEVTVTAPGELQKEIPASERFSITELQISGPLNGDDIRLIRELAGVDFNAQPTQGSLEILDLSEAHIVTGGGAYKGSLTTEDNVIGESMFSGCTKLVKVILPSDITTIETDAFSNCSSMTSIVLSQSLRSIGPAVFVNSGLTEITIPEGPTEIREYTFLSSRSLRRVYLPASVVKIGEEAFSGCPLTEISVAEGNSSFSTLDGVLYDKEQTRLLLYPFAKSDESYTIPETVIVVGEFAFKNATFKHIMMSEGLTEIGKNAFEGCAQLQSLEMPNSVTRVGAFAFSKCSSMTSVKISEQLDFLDEDVFAHCPGLTSITIPSSVKEIGVATFAFCKNLSNVALPSTLERIGDLAFTQCTGLKSLSIPDNVRSLGRGIFSGCSLLEEIALPNSLDSISYDMFAGCAGLKELIIPTQVRVIMHYAFKGSGLERVTIPASCAEIYDAAFLSCSSLVEITNYAPEPQALGMFVFEGVNTYDCLLKVPEGSAEAYRTAETWGEFDIVEFHNAVTPPNIVEAPVEVARYTVSGEPMSAPYDGVSIVVMSDGTAIKEVGIASSSSY